MTALTTTLGAIHRSHLPRIDDLRRLADRAPAIGARELADGLDGVLEFLEDTLLPHLGAEETVLHRAYTKALGGPGTAELLRFDHDEIRRRVAVLRGYRDDLAAQLLPVARREVVGDLYELHAILTLHLAKEDELCLPLLDRHLAEHTGEVLHDLRRSVELEQILADGG